MSTSTTTQALFGLANTLIIVHVVVALSLYVKRRSLHPIRGRSPLLVIASQISVAIHYPTQAFPIVFPDVVPECSPFVLVSLATVSIAVAALFLRFWRLWFLYFFACEKLALDRSRLELSASDSLKKSDAKQKPPSTWFLDHRHLVQDRHLAKTLALGSTAFLGTCFAVFYGTPNRTAPAPLPRVFELSDPCIAVQSASMYALSVGVGFPIILIVYLTFKLRTVRDNFKLKLELRLIMVVVAVASAVSLYERVAAVFITNLFFVAAVDLPLVWSYMHERRYSPGRFSKAKELPSLREILTDDDHRELRHKFKRRLLREFAIENYLFFYEVRFLGERCAKKWRAVQESTSLAGRCEFVDVVAREVLRVYRTYMTEEAPNEINIPHDTHAAVTAALRRRIPNFDAHIAASAAGAALSLPSSVPLKLVTDSGDADADFTDSDSDGEPLGGTDADAAEHVIELTIPTPTLTPTPESPKKRSSELLAPESSDLQRSTSENIVQIFDTVRSSSCGGDDGGLVALQLADLSAATRELLGVFDAPSEVIVSLMERDSFARWKTDYAQNRK